jgi:hypothetical protein
MNVLTEVVRELVRKALRESPESDMILATRGHIHTGEAEESSLSPEWKAAFKNVLEIHDDFLSSIPWERRGETDPQKLRSLNFQKTKLINELRHLVEAVASSHSNVNKNAFEEALREVATQELFLGPGLIIKANEWVFKVHSIITSLFNKIMYGIR